MKRRWTEAETRMLAEMWLCGNGSHVAASILPRTRNSVMGRINSQGLMGRKGRGLLPGTMRSVEAATIVAETFADVLGRRRLPGIGDDICSVLLAMVAVGRRSRRLAAVAGVSPDTVRSVDRRLVTTGAWTRRGGAPVEWWTDGKDAFTRTVRQIFEAGAAGDRTTQAA